MKLQMSRTPRSTKRTALAVALSLALSSAAVQAQTATGSIYGQAKGGSTVTLQNPSIGLKRSVTADASGRYSFGELPPGDYQISADDLTREAHVNAGAGSQVIFTGGDPANLSTVEVRANAITSLDVSSTDTSMVFSAAQLQRLPVQRDVTRVALLTPGTVQGDSSFGNGHLPSFGGASVAENGYYVNGFDVTNIHDFQSFFTIPFNAIGQVQIKNGGYGAEYGRSLGGVISVVTQRGTNEWKSGGQMTWEPDALRASLSNQPGVGGSYTSFKHSNTASEVNYNAYVGGPLVSDKLFMYAMVAGQNNTYNTYAPIGREQLSERVNNTKPHALLKLDWNISDNHAVEFLGVSSRDYDKTATWNTEEPYSTRRDERGLDYTIKHGGELYVGKYTGYLTDNFTVSAQYGQFKVLNDVRDPRNLAGADCPRVLDGRAVDNGASGPLAYMGCYDPGNLFPLDPNGPDPTDKRKAGRLDLEWKLGDHTLRGGYDGETFTSTGLGYHNTGGAYWRYYVYTGGKINGVAPPPGTTEYVRRWEQTAQSGSYDVKNTAWYLEDSWQASDRWLIYAGLRGESFENLDGIGRSLVKANNEIAPRLGVSWDVMGDATTKVSATLGRYYIPVASNTNLRASRAERFVTDYYTFTDIDPRTGAPTGLTHLGDQIVNTQGNIPVPGTFAATNLKPMYQDELILGFQHMFNSGWTGGVNAVVRRVGAGMDDFCWGGAFENWAADNGYHNFDVSSIPTCVLLNPGRDAAFNVDVNGDGQLKNVTIPAKYFMLPKYKRRYAALEFTFAKVYEDKWTLQGSYTWSHSYGNSEGYVDSNFQQTDAGSTANYDYPSFANGTYGNLPNDRRHSFKAFGSWKVAPEWMLSGNLLVQSGAPISCIGYLPLTGPEGEVLLRQVNNNYGPSSLYCNKGNDANGNAVQELHSRGSFGRTPWIKTFDLGLTWMPKIDRGQLMLKMDIFNVFNERKATRVYETGDIRTPDHPQHDPNFRLPVDFNQPRFVRFSAQLDF